eukprot:gb/GECG01012607.1/.p1 GENE.gb/GECG01012607.1/~~gb/GECG01012607.1/.p1  ORF type:complete len:623 (+),score=54.56 gb/GECG01012607.1/:1-1869(+)
MAASASEQQEEDPAVDRIENRQEISVLLEHIVPSKTRPAWIQRVHWNTATRILSFLILSQRDGETFEFPQTIYVLIKDETAEPFFLFAHSTAKDELSELCTQLSFDPEVQSRGKVVSLCQTILKRLNEQDPTRYLPSMPSHLEQGAEVDRACLSILSQNRLQFRAPGYISDQSWLTESSLAGCQHVSQERFPYRLLGLNCLFGFLSSAALHLRCATVCTPLPRLFYSHKNIGSEFEKMQNVCKGSLFEWLPELIASIQASHWDESHWSFMLSALSDQQRITLQWMLQSLPVGLEVLAAPGIRNPKFAQVSFIDSLPSGDPFRPSLELLVDCPSKPSFKKLKKQYGSDSKYITLQLGVFLMLLMTMELLSLCLCYDATVAFHGSSSENAFSIIQNGLKSFSHTRQMRSGAIFGDGVYFCNAHKVAKSFAASTGSVSRTSLVSGDVKTIERLRKALVGERLQSNTDTQKDNLKKCSFSVVFMCEVIKHPDNFVDERKQASEGAYYVVQDPQHIQLNRILVYFDNDRTMEDRKANTTGYDSHSSMTTTARKRRQPSQQTEGSRTSATHRESELPTPRPQRAAERRPWYRRIVYHFDWLIEIVVWLAVTFLHLLCCGMCRHRRAYD